MDMKKRLGFARKYSKNVKYALKNNGGFFPTDEENIDNYGEYLLNILGVLHYLELVVYIWKIIFLNTIVKRKTRSELGI